MKKSLIICACLLGMSSVALAARHRDDYWEPCQYTMLQNLIRDARSHERIFEMIRGGVPMEDDTITCGGTLFQLAVRRGNPSILNGILAQDKTRVNALVPTRDFNIPGAPETIPAVMFAAYYAPSPIMFKVMLDAGADVSVRDANGRDVLWYLDQNPVLRKSETEDQIQLILQKQLLEKARRQHEQPAPAAKAQINLKQIEEDSFVVEEPK